MSDLVEKVEKAIWDAFYGEGHANNCVVAAKAAIAIVRNATLEEAAKVAENLMPVGRDYPARGYEIASAIRALATPSGDGEGK